MSLLIPFLIKIYGKLGNMNLIFKYKYKFILISILIGNWNKIYIIIIREKNYHIYEMI